MIRDKHRDLAYFQRKKEFYTGALKRQLAKRVSIRPDRMTSYMMNLAIYNEYLFKICYSMGESPNEIFKYYKEGLKNDIDSIYEGTGLYDVIDYFAIGVLYSERKEEFIDDLKAMYDRITNTDDLLEYYAAYLFHDQIVPYHSIFEYQNMIEDTFESVQKAQGFWYYDHSDAPWYNSHKRHSYDGYWSFDTAATCKIKGIYDERLKELDYFPYDLLVQDNG